MRSIRTSRAVSASASPASSAGPSWRASRTAASSGSGDRHHPDATSASAEVMTHPRLAADDVLVDPPVTHPLARRIDELPRQ